MTATRGERRVVALLTGFQMRSFRMRTRAQGPTIFSGGVGAIRDDLPARRKRSLIRSRPGLDVLCGGESAHALTLCTTPRVKLDYSPAVFARCKAAEIDEAAEANQNSIATAPAIHAGASRSAGSSLTRNHFESRSPPTPGIHIKAPDSAATRAARRSPPALPATASLRRSRCFPSVDRATSRRSDCWSRTAGY
jgi:hypothetical protein